MRTGFSLVLVLGISANLFAVEPASREWKVDGVTREGLVAVPAKAKETPTPVVFAFHGHGGSAKQAARSFGYHTLWPEAIVVYLQGLNTPGQLTDPEGKKAGWQHSSGDQKDRDLKFFDEVLKSLKADYKVEEKRIYSTGHSNGGGFTYLLWSERGDAFAAVAPSGSVANTRKFKLTPKPVLHVAGETDPLVKYEWQKAGIAELKKLNGCAEDGKPWGGDKHTTQFDSKTGNPVVTYIHPGGHGFPSKEVPPLVVKFFQEHSKH